MNAQPVLVSWSLAALWIGCGERAMVDVAQPPLGQVIIEGQGLEPDLAKANAFFTTRPVFEQPLHAQLEPEAMGLSAAACGVCHQAIYDEWRVSTHAMAWVDRQFQAELGKNDIDWMCQNCHVPLRRQQEYWPVGLTDDDVERPVLVANPAFDASLRDEGITCAACHVFDGVVHGPGRATDAPHPVVVDTDLLDSTLCLRCHQAVQTYPGKNFVCTFETGAEWNAGPYPAEGQTCVTCHMPTVKRPMVEGGTPREGGHHWWRGAGIPKVAGVQPPLEANPPGLELGARVIDGVLELAFENARAGHRLPTGDPERWIQIDVVFADGTGRKLVEPFQIRIGQKWSWNPEPRRMSDNRLMPRERRVERIEIPADAVRVSVEASSHRMSAENADYHHLGEYPLSLKTHEIELDLQQ